MALPPLPKALRAFGSRDRAELERRVDEWARGQQLLVGALRDGNPAVLRRLDDLEARPVDAGGGGGGVSAHGLLTGLAADDHPQYLLADGTRALGGDWSAGSNKVTDLAAPTDPNDAARLVDIGDRVNIWCTDAAPASAHADDDECDTGSIDGSWTTWDEAAYQTRSASASRACYDITCTGNGTLRWGGLYKAIPASEFQVVAKLSFDTIHGAASVASGLFVGDLTTPSTGDIHNVYQTHAGASASPSVSRASWTAYNGTASNVFTGVDNYAQYIRLRVNGTSVSGDLSPDGLTWRLADANALATTVGFTPAHVGWSVHVGGTSAARCSLHWIRFLTGAGSSAFGYSIPGRLVNVGV